MTQWIDPSGPTQMLELGSEEDFFKSGMTLQDWIADRETALMENWKTIPPEHLDDFRRMITARK